MEKSDKVLAMETAVVVTPMDSVTMLRERDYGGDDKKY